MNELSDRDWELLNAYHDGELEEVESRELKARIESEPALALALKEVSRASSSLAALRPETEPPAADPFGMAANHNWKPSKWMAGGAAAAVLVFAVILGPKILAEPTALDIHAGFAKQAFSVSDDDLRLVATAAHESVPDLARANLTPVATQTLDAGDITHYAGRNGCRLTYFRGGFGFDAARLPRQQVEIWTTSDNQLHMIIASGMDQAKFDAIAAYLKNATQQKTTETAMAAMSDATTSAIPCVG